MTPLPALALAAGLAATSGGRPALPVRGVEDRPVKGAARAEIQTEPPPPEEVARIRTMTDEEIAARVSEIRSQLAALPPETRRDPPPLAGQRLALGNVLAHLQGEQTTRRIRAGLPPIPDASDPVFAPAAPQPEALASAPPNAPAPAPARPAPGPAPVVAAAVSPAPAADPVPAPAPADPGSRGTLAWAAALVAVAGAGAWLVRRARRA